VLVLELGREERIEHLAFAPDGRALVAVGQYGAWLWREIGDGARAQAVNSPLPLRYMRFAEGGKSLFFGTSNLWRVDVSTGTTVSQYRESVSAVRRFAGRAIPPPRRHRTRLRVTSALGRPVRRIS
jgi:hypothetical protein